jgi:type IV pilus assembly protein PilV
MTSRYSSRHPSGIGLIEVLIAVFVLAIAFFGVAALIVHALSTNNSAMARSVATITVYSILDAMRSDLANAKSGGYNTTVSADTCPASGSTLASVQINQWCTQLASPALGGAVKATTGTIGCDSDGTCTITVTWDDSRNGAIGGSGTQTVTTTGML